ncbi:hypothetical protein B9Q11_00705 [Candidatus Marsarchaeota G2 archaeon ECH_B_SAG-F08]|uniref:Membrane transport protein MMPL domain-containing protein n=1 Tax=Candidatus Marsarchaeota G2 archaeon ECH_B_SAG-F08 TaxID=1978165 RepID=A0A2R6BLM6_9ARCH|nr:MAG: hypothetical protein B9Q11_00705 [Candidatus Marsarchaeota G2 archaeon ECH_B_SAG-F08]
MQGIAKNLDWEGTNTQLSTLRWRKRVALISGITVAASLGALSFVAELRSWGPVLFMSVILSVLLVTTLLPALTSYIGPRISKVRSKPSRSKKQEAPDFTKPQAFRANTSILFWALYCLLAHPQSTLGSPFPQRQI